MKTPLFFQAFAILNISFFLLGIIFNQTGQITGVVTDSTGTALNDVEVYNLSNQFVAYSNDKGAFKINGDENDTIRFISKDFPVFDTVVTNTKSLTVRLGHHRKVMATVNSPKVAIEPHYSVPRKTATSKTIRGVVSDDAGALPGVNVFIKGTRSGTSTDFDGNYAIEAELGDELIFSFVGMKDTQVKVTNETHNVKLENDASRLEEVVVEGYSKRSVKKKSMASTTLIRGVSSVSDASPAEESLPLTGKVAGLSITTSSEPDKFKAGQLTAGEVNDFSKWTYWEDIAKPQLKQWQTLWRMAPEMRFSVILTHSDGFAVQDQTVHLLSGRDTLWTSHTGNTGRAELWFKPEIIKEKTMPDNLTIVDGNGTIITGKPKEFRAGINTFTYSDNCVTPEKINIAFMVDATGSMGDEIRYLQSELSDVISRTKKALPDAQLSMASVFYRDKGDDYVVKKFDFTENIPDVISFMQRQSAGGGGDYPEAAVEAFESAIDELHWDENARARLLFVVLDAPPHENDANFVKLQALSRRASAKGIRMIPVAASGIDKSTEYLMRAMALQTNGTYLFITNHSGIGNDHIEPSTDTYTVEMLNDLLFRIILQFIATGDCQAQTLPTNTKMDAALEKKQTVNWKYYPNPTSGKVTIECGKKASGLSVYDTTGKLVLHRKDSDDTYVLDLTGLPNAIYYLNVQVGEKTLFGKIIKQM